MTPLRLGMLVAFVVLASSSLHAGEEQAWGDVKGQVVWGGDKLPEPQTVNIGRGNAIIIGKGPLLPDPNLMVDKKTRGVRWVMVWLADKDRPKDPKIPLPVHPCMKELQEKELTIDLSGCLFDPYVFGIRVGQTLLFKNDLGVVHNVMVEGGEGNPYGGPFVLKHDLLELQGFRPTKAAPILFSCQNNRWMKAYARVFNHPYFAVTNAKGEFELKDAPAGKFRLIGWHPEIGWLTKRDGEEILIKANRATDLGKILLKPTP